MGFKIIVTAANGKFQIKPPSGSNNWGPLLQGIPSKRYYKAAGYWAVSAVWRNVQYLRDHVFPIADLDQSAQDLVQEVLIRRQHLTEGSTFPRTHPFKTKPMEHQMTALDRSYGRSCFGFFMEMGTGKSKINIDLISAMMSHGMIDRALIQCPVAVRRNWLDEIKKHWPEQIPHEVMICDPKSKHSRSRLKMFCDNPDPGKILILGTESLSQGEKRGNSFSAALDFVTGHKSAHSVDESHLIKTHNSIRTTNTSLLGLASAHRYIYTGTPISLGLMDLYGQINFMDSEIIGCENFYSYRARYAQMGGYQNKMIIGYNNVDELTEAIKPYIYQVTKEEVLELPDKVYTTRQYDLTKQQLSTYKQIKTDRYALLSGTQVNEENIDLIVDSILEMVLLLQQVCAGYVTWSEPDPEQKIDYDDPDFKPKMIRKMRRLVEPHRNPKIKEFLSFAKTLHAERSQAKILVWSVYKPPLEDLYQVLVNEYGAEAVVLYTGDFSEAELDKAKKSFQSDPEKLFWLATLQKGGTGLTINEAKHSYFLTNSRVLIHRLQAEDRNHRIGQNQSVLYVDSTASGTVEEDIVRSNQQKKDFAAYIKTKLSEQHISEVIDSL